MTNGEKIKEIFPDCFIVRRLSDNKIVHLVCTEEFLNSEYKEPTTKNDLAVDAVSREAVNELVSSQRLDTFSDEGRKWANIKIDVILRGLKELPSVTPQEPKTGHWVEYTRVLIPEPINKWEQAWYCSECGYGNQDSDESAWLEWNYCPNCGAKMVEPQESEE